MARFGKLWFVVLVLLASADALPISSPKSFVRNIAHRGSSGVAPENTMPAFELGFQQGAHGLETDLHLSKDGHLVLIHDSTLERTTNGKGKVSDHTLSELRELDAGSWKSPAYKGAKIPTILEALALIEAYAESWIVFDLKDHSPHVLEVLKTVLVDFPHLTDRIVVGCWDDTQLEQAHSLLPHIKSALIASTLPSYDQWTWFKSVDLGGFNLNYHALDAKKSFIAKAKESSFLVFAWTVNDAADIAKVKSWDIDAVLTDYPNLYSASNSTDTISVVSNKSEWAARACLEAVAGTVHRTPATTVLAASKKCQQFASTCGSGLLQSGCDAKALHLVDLLHSVTA